MIPLPYLFSNFAFLNYFITDYITFMVSNRLTRRSEVEWFRTTMHHLFFSALRICGHSHCQAAAHSCSDTRAHVASFRTKTLSFLICFWPADFLPYQFLLISLWIWFLGLPFSKCKVLCSVKEFIRLFCHCDKCLWKPQMDSQEVISPEFYCLWKGKFSYWHIHLGNTSCFIWAGVQLDVNL